MAGCSSAVTLTIAGLVAGCSAGDGFMSSVTLPADSATTTSPSASPMASAPSTPPNGSPSPSRMAVTDQQREYLEALAVGGVHPSSDLLALSIGSYVCQARAAGQSPQAVWDFVHPLVSTDVHDSHMRSMSPSSADIDAITASYIRIATDRLC